MYGQKQILQCLAIAIVLAVFNFHRSAINRNKESTKRIATRPSVVAPILTEKQANQTGYCIRNPFGTNRLANFESWISCHYVCFDKFDTWLRTQCTANCCVNKTVTPKCPPFSAQLKSVMQTTRNRENALTKSASIGARQQDKRIPVEHVIETSIYQKINGGKYKLAEEHECKIQTDNEHICSNTTSGNGNIVTLEQNETQLIMEYHEFLFNAESLKPGVVSHSHHGIYQIILNTKIKPTIFFTFTIQSNPIIFCASGAKSSILFALFSIIMAMITAKYLYKLFVTDHVSSDYLKFVKSNVFLR